jgi:protein TonB
MQLAPENTPIPPGEVLTAPKLLSGPAYPAYTRGAMECGIQGKVIARCTLTVEGRLVDCTLVKTLPFLGEAVLRMLATQQYAPAVYQGHPQAIFYTQTFRFKLP